MKKVAFSASMIVWKKHSMANLSFFHHSKTKKGKQSLQNNIGYSWQKDSWAKNCYKTLFDTDCQCKIWKFHLLSISHRIFLKTFSKVCYSPLSRRNSLGYLHNVAWVVIPLPKPSSTEALDCISEMPYHKTEMRRKHFNNIKITDHLGLHHDNTNRSHKLWTAYNNLL